MSMMLKTMILNGERIINILSRKFGEESFFSFYKKESEMMFLIVKWVDENAEKSEEFLQKTLDINPKINNPHAITITLNNTMGDRFTKVLHYCKNPGPNQTEIQYNFSDTYIIEIIKSLGDGTKNSDSEDKERGKNLVELMLIMHDNRLLRQLSPGTRDRVQKTLTAYGLDLETYVGSLLKDL